MTGDIYIYGGGHVNWITVTSLAIAALTILSTLYWNIRSERRGYLDQFWFREIFAPSCVTPVIKLREDWVKKISNMSLKPQDAAVRNALSAFAGDKARVLRSLWLSKIFFKNYYLDACAALDNTEDEIANAFGRWLAKGGPNGDDPAPLVEVSTIISDGCIGVIRLAAILHGRRLHIK